MGKLKFSQQVEKSLRLCYYDIQIYKCAASVIAAYYGTNGEPANVAIKNITLAPSGEAVPLTNETRRSLKKVRISTK